MSLGIGRLIMFPVYKQRVISLFLLLILDAVGLRNVITLHSKHNLVKKEMQRKERYFVMPGQSVASIPAYVQHLIFCGDFSKEIYSLTLSDIYFHQLKSVLFTTHCFKSVKVFVINDLTSLESLIIGKRCFTLDRWRKRNTDSVCRIANCPNLRHLAIDDGSFADYDSFQLFDLNSLQSIDFGKETFNYCNLVLQGKHYLVKPMRF